MPSHIRRIIIEEYENGGFGIHEYAKEDIMGLTNEMDLMEELARILNPRRKKEGVM